MKQDPGAYAALLTPRTMAGGLDLQGFERQVEQLAQTSIKGVAVNGATGEFPLGAADELPALLRVLGRTMKGRTVLCGIGAGSLPATLDRGRVALAEGADALLLPMPSFFPYRQDDLRAFANAVAAELRAPILLYNLPQFTTGLGVETVLTLLGENEYLIGVKDSSGSLDILRAITRAELPGLRWVGNDSVLCAALAEGCCDGVVSGVASALPELMTSFFRHAPDSREFSEARGLLDEFIHRIGGLPTPWGLKVTSALRGMAGGAFPLPLSPEREREIAALEAWFLPWYRSTLELSRASDERVAEGAGVR